MDPRASKPSVEQVHALLTAPGERFEMAELHVGALGALDELRAAGTGELAEARRHLPIRTWRNAPPDLPSVLRALPYQPEPVSTSPKRCTARRKEIRCLYRKWFAT